MKIAPSLCLPVSPRQTPTSYASQMGMKVGRSARDFCLDHKFTFQGIVDGVPSAIEALIQTCSLAPGAFAQSTVLKVAEGRYEIAGQSLALSALSRAKVRICPSCAIEDLATSHGPAGVIGRIEWQVASIRTCPRHNVKLILAGNDPTPSRHHDFSWQVKPILADREHLGDLQEHRAPSSLEKHLLALLSGESSEKLMGLPFYAVAKLSEIVGAMITFGKRTSWKTKSEDDWHVAGAIGFNTIASGWDGFTAFLIDLQEKHVGERRNWGPRTVFGRLYEILAHESEDDAYDPVRAFMFDHICSSMPVGPGDQVFNAAVTDRKLHSVRSAGVEFGVHPKRLKKLLHANGLIDDDDLLKVDDHVLVPVQEMTRFMALQEGTMSRREMADYLNLPRPHDALLIDAGLLVPAFEGSQGQSRRDAYSTADMDRFLERLKKRAVPLGEGEPEFHWIGGAGKRASCSAVEIVQLLLDDKLERVRIAPGVRGYQSILLDAEEIKPLVRWADHGGISLRDTEKLLSSSTRVVKALIEGNHLSSFVAPSPIKRAPATYVEPGEIDRFLATYASLSHLERETSIHFMKIAKALRAANVSTAFDPEEVHATFYRRHEVTEPLAQLRDQIDLSIPR